ncbi:MAG: serine/threonine-protein kinase, partial [Planctomycetaceae bacterium]
MTEESTERNPVEVLAEEYIRRQRNGEHPTVNEYAERFPDWAAEIHDVFPTLLMIEKLKPSAEELDPPHDHLPVDSLGDYRILQEIGRGGMGVVYEAVQESLDRRVALKVLYGRSLDNPHRLRRFEREAQTAAKLHHTNIVPVFGVGAQEGMHYYVMQLISGQGLDRILAAMRQEPSPIPSTQSFPASISDESPSSIVDSHSMSPIRLAHNLVSGQSGSLSATIPATESSIQPGDPSAPSESIEPVTVAAAAQHDQPVRLLNPQGPTPTELDNVYWQNVASIGIQVAEALRYAHEQDVLHRDIKPANLLLNDQGTVWITDFGLAKLVEDNSLTNSGDIVGTLSYMAPEQFDGLSDHRSDIYSLGLTLYELVTLKPAFDDSDRRRLIKQVTQNTPVQPRKINPSIPVDLETVILKAICRE